MKKINTHNAPALCRHLEALAKLSGTDYPYPFELYYTLVKLERKANRLTTALCNGVEDEQPYEKQLEKIRSKVEKLLPNAKTFFINYDPRGAALKIKEEERKELNLWQDFGGYGILAPQF